MVDPLFGDARLAPLYDTFEGDRSDLTAYLALLREFDVRSLLDVGCGTGTFALLAAATGVHVTGVDPAVASVAVARGKAGAEAVDWQVGTVDDSPALQVDLAVMTGNVAQVFLEDDDWVRTLDAIRNRLRPGGRLVFETRRPEARAWESWAEPFEAGWTFPDVGLVRQRRQLLSVELPLVSFRTTYEFDDGTEIDSDSTLRFRTDAENRDLLARGGFSVDEVRDAPDRPGREFVYVVVIDETLGR